ncbi:echinoderm microtubule associated protein like 1 [Turdus rufiventris]|nr:echinoderm microtubule associated protein like 1 [Turdus rufiventris]
MEDGFSSYSSLYDTSSLLQFCNAFHKAFYPDLLLPRKHPSMSHMEMLFKELAGCGRWVLVLPLKQKSDLSEVHPNPELRKNKRTLALKLSGHISLKDQSMIKKAAAEADKLVSPATTARPLVQTLPLRTTVNNGTVLPKKPSGSLPSPSGNRKETVSPAAKSTIKRTSSAERVSPGGRRESYGDSKGSRNRTGSTSSSSSGKKNSESKPKEPMFSAEEGYVKMFLRGRPVTMYMPKEQVESYNLEAKVELPAKRLKLEWVYPFCAGGLLEINHSIMIWLDQHTSYGYRGRDCRSNLYLLPTGETVYFIASVVVLFNVEEQLQRHYTGHNDDVKCLAVHPDRITIATGQVAGTSKDGKQLPPHVRVWDSVTLNTLHVIGMGFFDRAVTCIAFSKSKQEKPKFVLCVTFSENGDTITGDSSGNILVWGKGTNRISHAVQGAHEGGIFALCMLRDGTLVSGGGKDRKLISWNGNYQKIHKTEIPEQFGPIRTVAEGKGDVVLIGTTRNFVLQGTLSGDFFPITQGHTDELWGLAVHSSKPQFFTCGHDKHITLWDATTHHPIWNGNFLAIGSHDNCIYIYGVSENGRKYTRIGKCSGHSSFITHLDWSVNSQYLVSNSGDYEILYWIPSACKQVVSVETTRDIEWATYTCTLGFHVFGVWPEGSDGTDINAVCRSHGRKLLSTGDDFGKVHLFSYPCSQFRAPSHVYGGHSSHVTNVDFLCEDTHLISTGGKDTSIMQWRVI